MSEGSQSGGRRGWFGRLKAGLARTTTSLTQGIATILRRGKLDAATLDELEEQLIEADLGVATAAAVRERFGTQRLGTDVTDEEVRAALAQEIVAVLGPLARPLAPQAQRRPHVVLVTGVNGTGKTTTVGKLAHRFKRDGFSVVLAAADTFRAAAIEQLMIWGERAAVPVVRGAAGGDAAGVAFAGLEEAKRIGADVLLIDTAGRLHNKANLMAELSKIVRVIKKLDATAPHDTILVLDATTGQNALRQVEAFKEVCDLTGLIMTKLDGTARGGVLVAIAERFRLPIHAIGVGETIEDLQTFDAQAFAEALTGAPDRAADS